MTPRAPLQRGSHAGPVPATDGPIATCENGATHAKTDVAGDSPGPLGRALTDAPNLTTQRLILRGPQDSDLDPFTQMVTTSDRMADLGGNGTSTQAWRSFIAGIGHWQMRDYGFFTITDRTTWQIYGRCGLLRHVGWPETELAWHLFDGAEGRGIAFEAAVAVRQWAGADLNLDPLASFIAASNTRSRGLAHRLGAAEEGPRTIDGDEAIVHRHLPHNDPFARIQWLEVAP